MTCRKLNSSRLTIEFASSALNSPIVVAVIVNVAFAIEQKTILARFQRQRAICAQEKLITIIWMSVSLFAIRIRAMRCSSTMS